MARQEMTVAFHLGRWRDVDRFEVYFGDGNHMPCDRLEVVEESFMTSGFPGGWKDWGRFGLVMNIKNSF